MERTGFELYIIGLIVFFVPIIIGKIITANED
jgi:hypothetical protein